MMLENLKVEIYSDGRIDIGFLMKRTRYNIRIHIYEYFYRLTGSKCSSKTSYFSNSKAIHLEIFDEVVKCLNKHIPKINETNLIDIIALAIAKTDIIEGDWTLSRFMTKLQSQKSLHELENYMKFIEVKGEHIQEKYECDCGPSTMMSKEQRLNSLLVDIETIERMLVKVKKSARLLQAEIDEEEK